MIAKNTDHLDLWTLPATLAELEDLEIPGAGLFVFIRRTQLFNFRAPHNEEFSDVLDWCCIELLAQLIEQGFAQCTVIAKNADFDEAMRAEGCAGFLENGRRQAVIADHHHWVKMMGL